MSKPTGDGKSKSADVRAFENSDVAKAADVRPIDFDCDLHVRRIGELVGAEIDATPKEMLELGVQDFSRASRLMVRSGWYLLAAKAHFGHGSFIAELEARDIDPRRAQELMKFAANIQRLPEDQAEQLLSLQPSKAMALANTDPEVVEDLLNEEDGDYADLSVRALRGKVKELERRKANVDTRNTELAAENQELKAALVNKAKADHLPGPCLIARHEAAALSQQIIQAVESLEDTFAQQVLSPALAEDPRVQAIAINSVYHAMAGAAARCYGFIDALQKGYSKQIGGIDELLPFTEDEVESLVAARRLLVAEHQQDREARKAERAQTQPKKRGRPRKRIEGDA